MAREILTDYDFKNASRIVNLPEATSNTEPVILSQLNKIVNESSQIDDQEAVDGSIPVYNESLGKFLATESNTKLTLTDGGNF
jgi:hypothetical protein